MVFLTSNSVLHTTGDMKREAKAQLKGNWKSVVLLCLVPAVISILIAFLVFGIGLFIATDSGYSDAGNNSFNVILEFGRNIIFIGISYTFLDMIRSDKSDIYPLKDAFQVFSSQYFLGNFLIYILKQLYLFLWSLLLLIPGIIKIFSYSQAHFVYKDLTDDGKRRDVNANHCITESRKLMDGHKMDLFILELSFIGWHILSLFLLGIPYIWLIPYLETTRAVFYQNLIMEYYRDNEYYSDDYIKINDFENDEFTDF